MAEKLASRNPERTDTTVPNAHDAFDDIIAHEYNAHDQAILDDIITDHERGLNSSDPSGHNELFDESAFTADAPDSSFFGREDGSATPSASVASPTALTVPAPTRTLPATPAPTLPLTPVPAPTPETPSRVRTNMGPSPDHPPTDTPPPETPVLPPTDEHDPGRRSAASELKLVMVDQSKDVESFARDAADARLTEELNEGGWLKRLRKGVWKGGLAKNFFRNKYISEARADIIAHQDVLVRAESSKAKRDAAMQATIERFGHDLGSRLINRNADDTLEQYTAHEKDSAFSRTMKDFVRECVVKGLDDAAITEQYKRVAHEYRINHPDDETVGEGLVQLSNITELIKATKGAVEHGESLDNVVEGMKIITGEARTGVRSEARQTATDKAVEWMSKRRLTAWVPEGVIAGASSVASFVVRAGSSKTIGVLTSPFTLGLSLIAPAVVGGARERARVKEDRNQHSREMAMGGNEIDATAALQTRRQKLLGKIFGNRREQMEKTRLNTLSAYGVTTDLRSKHEAILLDDADRDPGTTKDDALRAAIDALAEIEVYNLTSDNKKKDLIAYDGVASIPEQRFQLALARAELKAALDGELDDATKARLGFAAEGNVDAILERQATGAIETIAEDVDKKDAAFKRMRRFRVAKMAGIAVVAGAVLGGVAQETVSTFTDTNGVVERAWGGGGDLHNGAEHQTIAERLINGAEQNPGHHGPSSEFTSPTAVGERGQVSVSADHSIVKNEDGTINLVDPSGKSTIENLEVNPDGSLPQSSIDTLNEHGMKVDNISTTKDVLDAAPKQVGLDEYMQEHRGDTTPVTRDYWYDNDTDAPNENERRLQWTGTGYVTENGRTSYHLNVAAMTENGSKHAGHAAHWAELARQGKMTATIIPDAKFQAAPMLVDLNPDGTINVGPDDEAAKFFTVRDGEPVFTGAYLEPSEVESVDADGTMHIRPLATLEGTGEASNGTYEVASYHQEVQPAYKITTNGYDTPASFVEVAPSIPITSRKSLENLRRAPVERPNDRQPNNYNKYGSGYPGGGASEAWRRQMETDRMPELRRDPSARVSLAEGVRWHHDLTKRKDPEYAREIGDLVSSLPNMANLDAKTSTIVPILVGASFEHDNIYRTLSLYAQMPTSWQAETQLILHVNWIDSKENDPAEKAKIDKTKAEIARAIRDFPDLQISQFESIWSQEKVDKGEYGDRLIAHAAQKLVDVSMEAAYQAIEAGRMPEDHDILLWKGDADAQGMGRNAGPKMTKAFKDHPEADAFSGGVRWGTEKYKDLPGLGFTVNFMEIYRIAAQRAHIKGFQSTFGVNGGARMSTFAAIGGIGHYTNQQDSPPDDGWGDRLFAARNPTLGGTAGAYGATGGGTTANNDYHIHVGGASIDTDASRFEKVWTSGEPITSIWGNVNANGYQGRTTGLKPGQKEDLRRNPDEVIARIEYNMSDLISHWTAEPAQVSTALAIMLPGPNDLGGNPAYTLTPTPEGGSKFSLTPRGKKWLISRLQYNSKGQYDPYGDRQARQLYGRVKKRGATRWSIPVKQTASRMVAGRT